MSYIIIDPTKLFSDLCLSKFLAKSFVYELCMVWFTNINRCQVKIVRMGFKAGTMSMDENKC